MNKYGLKREILIDIINKNNNDDNVILSLLKDEFVFYDYYQDKRFMPELKDNIQWRHDFLKEEAKTHIKEGDVDFAYKNLFELIRAENPVLHGSNILKMHFINESDKEKHEDYYKDGYICEKEKNIIMEIINAIEEKENNNVTTMENQNLNNITKSNQIIKEKTKYLIKSVLFSLIFGSTGFMLLMEFFKTKNILYIIISIMMFLVTLLLLSPFYEKFIFKKNKSQKNPISKSVKDMLSEDTYNKLKKLYIGELDIIFFERENIDAGQIGFRYTGFFNEIEEIIDEWPGNEYVIIGYDSTAGCGPDPYIMKTDEKELPIYWLMTDGGDWKNPNKIANSFNDFIKIIDCINENLNSENELNKELILSEIAKINSNENMEYWKILLTHLKPHLDVQNNESNPMFELVINEYKKLTEKECYNINLMEEEPGILDNKIGGKPYLPIGEEYPIDKFGNPMELLLQINLNDIQLEGWPKEGILEIFISLEEDDYEYNCTIKLFKENLEYQTTFPEIKFSYPTIKQGYKIKLTKNICHMPITDNRFNDTIWSIIESGYHVEKNVATPLYKIFGTTKWNEELSSSINNHLVTIGGYSEFVDAPLYDEDDNKIEILFKLDPNINPSNFDIIEQRILNVIIYKDDILSLNFKNVKINY